MSDQLIKAASKSHELLDLQQKPNSDTTMRGAPRMKFRSMVRCVLTQPGGSVSNVLAVARDLSSTGIGLLLRSFVYPDTAVRIDLRTHEGAEETVGGHVKWCRHLNGGMHHLGVVWDHPLQPERFVDPEDLSKLFEVDDKSARRLRGAVMLVTPMEFEVELLQHMIRHTRITMAKTDCAETARTQLMSQSADSVIIGHPNDLKQLGEAVQSIRKLPYHGTIIALTDESTQDGMKRLETAGAQVVLSRPFSEYQLLAVLSVGLGYRNSTQSEVVEEALRPLQSQFIAHAVEQARHIRDAVQVRDLRMARLACSRLTSAASLGFSEIGGLVADLSNKLAGGGSEEAYKQLADLAMLVEQFAAEDEIQ